MSLRDITFQKKLRSMNKYSTELPRCGAMLVSPLRDPNVAFIKKVLAPVLANHRLIYFVCDDGYILTSLAAKIISEDQRHVAKLVVPYAGYRPKVYQQKLFLQDAKKRAQLLYPPQQRMFMQHVKIMAKSMLQVFTVHAKIDLDAEVIDLTEDYQTWLKSGNTQSCT